jgi:hypothetical protein
MKTIVIAAFLAAPFAVAAQPQKPAQAGEAGFHMRLYERYCDKARQGPEAYVQFVRRMYTVTGLAVNDFVPERRGARVVHDCGLTPERTASLQRELYASAAR